MQIAKIMRQTQLIGVFCSDREVDPQVCVFFTRALRVFLQRAGLPPTHTMPSPDGDTIYIEGVGLYDGSGEPELFGPSFYTPPIMIPFTDVTLKLIESRSPSGTVQVTLGGFCFDRNIAYDSKGFQSQLTRWTVSEGSSDIGPLESDKAAAGRKLAQEFAAYWMDTISQRNSLPEQPTQ